jgi:hypothetical protein
MDHRRHAGTLVSTLHVSVFHLRVTDRPRKARWKVDGEARVPNRQSAFECPPCKKGSNAGFPACKPGFFSNAACCARSHFLNPGSMPNLPKRAISEALSSSGSQESETHFDMLSIIPLSRRISWRHNTLLRRPLLVSAKISHSPMHSYLT